MAANNCFSLGSDWLDISKLLTGVESQLLRRTHLFTVGLLPVCFTANRDILFMICRVFSYSLCVFVPH
jgi:hypothetical protein